MKRFDAIIIGSGQAGTPLAFDLAARGMQVAFIEKEKLGGTCVNVGCTPTKAYVASARRMWDIAHSAELGVDVEGVFLANLLKIKKRKDLLIEETIADIKKAISTNDSITVFKGEARFISNKVVEINGNQLTAPHIFINVGARPFVPDEYREIPYLTNESILELNDLPKHLLIIGGSYIGLEFAQMFKRFGCQVTLIEREDRLIAKEDEDVSDCIRNFLKEEDVSFIFNAKELVLTKTEEGISAWINKKDKIEGSHVLLAIGRKSNADLLNLDATSIKMNDKAYVEVDDYCQTTVDGVFALGDCNGKGAFTHTAYNDFEIVKNYLFGDKTRKISDRILTYGLFVDPPLGRCGLTKKDAIEKGIAVLEGKMAMENISRAKEKGEKKGFLSVLVDEKTDRIIGACVLGAGGDEIITSILNVMYSDKPYQLIRDSVVLHPTISELIPTTLEKLKAVKK